MRALPVEHSEFAQALTGPIPGLLPVATLLLGLESVDNLHLHLLVHPIGGVPAIIASVPFGHDWGELRVEDGFLFRQVDQMGLAQRHTLCPILVDSLGEDVGPTVGEPLGADQVVPHATSLRRSLPVGEAGGRDHPSSAGRPSLAQKHGTQRVGRQEGAGAQASRHTSAVTCGQSPYQYSNLSRGKYDVALYQLAKFEGLLPDLPSVFNWRREGEHHPAAPVWAHSDGAILQVYGAFDAVACAIAHRFDLPDSKRASFGRLLAAQLPAAEAPVRESILAVVGSTEWNELDNLRDEAAHRGVVVRHFSASADGTQIYVDPHGAPERREAFSLVCGLVIWAGGPLRWFWHGVEAWRESWEPSVIGSMMDLDAGPNAPF